MLKKELRNIYRAKRNAIDSKEKLKLDDLMLLQFQQLNYDGIETLLSYWPMHNTNEPNTFLFSRYLHHVIYNLQTAYPVTDFSDCSIKALVINEDTVYTTNQFGLMEPKDGVEINAEAIDLIFVPLLCFDEAGYRVGYGKGFYDRFLSQCGQHVIKIGFSYFDAVDKIDDANQFDVPLNYCITPQKIYEF
ncbi:MAG: 5-formyltetrahydrofolate cyclo-ligase [Chitinophaga sp.]|jgi:5-formyltetrahydrofolate cyclo-ligase|nr:5-formyltetrahydrofolate cyclo-ligase [Chitinophaga sp.]